MSIETLMGMALGCIGMSRDDFERCTPAEFHQVWQRWAEARRDAERGEWERTRVLALFAVSPYTKGNLRAHDILPFPWDDEQTEERREKLSREELNARFEAAKKRFGLK